jgi:hypothetical protein
MLGKTAAPLHGEGKAKKEKAKGESLTKVTNE